MTQANKQQVNILTSFMEKHPDVAKSFSNASSNARDAHRFLWERLIVSLNSNGPPTKTIKEWKRVWAVRKYHAKQKLIKNKKSIIKTGGGPYSEEVLDENDEAIIKACGINAAIDGISGAKSFGCNEEDYDDVEFLDIMESPPKNKLEEPPIVEIKSGPAEKCATKSRKNRMANADDGTSMLAKKQIELQEKFIQNQSNQSGALIKSLNDINKSIQELKNSINTLLLERELKLELNSNYG